jgi:hypothetical protein
MRHTYLDDQRGMVNFLLVRKPRAGADIAAGRACFRLYGVITTRGMVVRYRAVGRGEEAAHVLCVGLCLKGSEKRLLSPHRAARCSLVVEAGMLQNQGRVEKVGGRLIGTRRRSRGGRQRQDQAGGDTHLE